jgi:D-alanyl-D-alanine dipeptidase
LKAKVYDCAECYPLKTVTALIDANKKFSKKDIVLKIWLPPTLTFKKKCGHCLSIPVATCKRFHLIQRRSGWYYFKVDLQGAELETTSSFDFFGKEAAHNYKKFINKVNAIGKILKSVMISSGFNPSDSEWWHYNLKSGLKDNVSRKMELQPSFTSNIR